MSEAAPFAALVLAAGRSTRMGGPNKLLQDWRGKPLVRHAVESAVASGAAPVLVVTGHQAEAVATALGGLPVALVHNPLFAEGLATSLKAGVAALPDAMQAVAVMLGDMPLVNAGLLQHLAHALDGRPDALAAVPVRNAEWGNPVLLRAALFPRIAGLSGDAGARKLLQGERDRVVACPVEDDAVALDIDTPDALAALRDR
ncbi:MAG: nucleotidyltransferase family protein [Alsobacter sp.]